jgi:hypothetical protein
VQETPNDRTVARQNNWIALIIIKNLRPPTQNGYSHASSLISRRHDRLDFCFEVPDLRSFERYGFWIKRSFGIDYVKKETPRIDR